MRTPSPRQSTLAAVLASTLVAAGAMVLGVLDVLIPFAFGVLAALLIGLRRVDGKVQRLIWNHRKHAESTPVPAADPEVHARIDEMLASLGEDRVMALTHKDVFSNRLTDVEDRMASVVSALAGQVSALADQTVALRQRLDAVSEEVSAVAPRLGELADGMKALKRAGDVSYEQVEAYIDLRGVIRPRAPMPALRGWAASPDVVRLLAETMWRRRPKLIVECGSGSSSVWLGYLAEQTGSRVIALEHDEHFARISRDLVQAHRLQDVVQVRLAPLTEWKSAAQTYRWYDTEALADLTDIGLLFVDGPPGTTGPLARYPALPLLLPRCGDEAVIVLDDSARPEETAISDRWLAEHPELERVAQRFDKGAHVFFRRAL